MTFLEFDSWFKVFILLESYINWLFNSFYMFGGMNQVKLKGLELNIKEEKMRFLGRGLGRHPSKSSPNGFLNFSPGTPRQPEHPKPVSGVYGLAPHVAQSIKGARFSTPSHFFPYLLLSNIPKFSSWFLYSKVCIKIMKSFIT